MTTLEKLCQTIDENPTETYRWLILADYLEEEGDKRADGLRWLVENERIPTLSKDKNTIEAKYRWSGLGDKAYDYYEKTTGLYTRLERLPSGWFPIQNGWDYHGFYKTMSDAILIAAEKFSTIGVNANEPTIINH